MKQPLILAAPLAAAALLVSCKNPADETADAEVGEKKAPSSAETPQDAVKYVFTDNSTIGFVGSKVTGSSHDGGFKEFTGHFFIKDGEPVGTGHQVVIDMNSIWSDSDRLTRHLKNEDFFEVATYPTTTFDNIAIEKSSDSQYTVSGNLEMHGVTKGLSFPATVTMDGDTARIEAEFDINRYDWNIEYKGTGDNVVREEVILNFNLEARPE